MPGLNLLHVRAVSCHMLTSRKRDSIEAAAVQCTVPLQCKQALPAATLEPRKWTAKALMGSATPQLGRINALLCPTESACCGGCMLADACSEHGLGAQRAVMAALLQHFSQGCAAAAPNQPCAACSHIDSTTLRWVKAGIQPFLGRGLRLSWLLAGLLGWHFLARCSAGLLRNLCWRFGWRLRWWLLGSCHPAMHCQ